MSSFRKAVRTQARARVAIDGPAKAGKSFTSLRLAFALGKRVAAIDTEFGSLSKYAGEQPDGEGPFDFDVVELTRFAPADYIAAIHEAESAKYDILIIDSLSHAWVGEGGILDQADRSTERNNFAKWRDLTPQQRRLVDTILACRAHVICTMRSKMEYVLEKDEYDGKLKPRKLGLAPVQRDGMEYEFDLLCSVSQDHLVTVSGSRCPAMSGAIAPSPGASFFRPYVQWLGLGVPVELTTTDQVARIVAHLDRVGVNQDSALAKVRSDYGVSTWSELTVAQANRIERRLEAAPSNLNGGGHP